MSAQVIMLIWTLVTPSSTTSQSGVAVTQTTTVVSASACEETKRRIVAGAKASGSVNTHPDARVYITIECIPIK